MIERFRNVGAVVALSLFSALPLVAQDDPDANLDFSSYRLKDGQSIRGAVLKTEGSRIQMRVSIAGGAGRATQWYEMSRFDGSSQIRLKSAQVADGDVAGHVSIAEFAAGQGLCADAGRELRKAFDMAEADPPGTHSGLKDRVLDVIIVLLRDGCDRGKVSEARSALNRFLHGRGKGLSEGDKRRLVDVVEAAADKRKADAKAKRRAAQDAKAQAELDKKIAKAIKLLEQGQAARRKGMLDSKNFGTATSHLKRATKKFEQAIAEAEKIKKTHANDKALVAEIDAGIADAKVQWQDTILSSASMRLTRGQFNNAMADVNRVLADDPRNAEALAMRARIEIAANDWGNGRTLW